MERFDIAVIGTGPAGLEAAITAKIRNKRVLLIGNNSLSTKVGQAQMIQNYLGIPSVTGKDLRDNFLQHLAQMELNITEDKITGIYSMGDYFAMSGQEEIYEANAVILACGVANAKMLPGEQQYLGKGVSYCATCDAALYRGRTAIVIGDSGEEEKEAIFLAEIAEKVYYIPLYKELQYMENHEKIEIIQEKKPVSISRTDDKTILHFEGEDSKLEADGLFILRQSIAVSQLVPGLQIEDNHVVTNRMMQTNIDGLFACGDITGTPYQYIKAAGEGNIAAISAVKYLADCDVMRRKTQQIVNDSK